MSPKPVSRLTRSPCSRPVLPKVEKVNGLTSQKNGVKKPAKSLAKKPAEPKSTTQKVLPTRYSTRLATKQTVSSVATVKSSEASKTRSTKSPSTKKGVVSKKRAAVGKKPATQASEKTVCTGRNASAGKKVRKSPARKQAMDPESVDVPVCVVPTTPKKSYQPVHPSPLLNCRSASKCQQIPSEAAWIPGAPAPDCTSNPSFENIFSTKFSPFRFTAGSDAGQDFQFHFRMDIQEAGKSTGGGSESCDAVGESADVLQANRSTCQPNSPYNSAALMSDGTLTSDTAPASVLGDLIIFSDASDCSMTEELGTPRLRRSTRNVSRKCYSSTKPHRKSTAPDDSTSDEVDYTHRSAKKVLSQQSSHTGGTEGVVSTSARVEDVAITTSDSSLPSGNMPSNTHTKLLPDSSSRKKSRRSSRRGSTMEAGEGVVRNLEEDYDKENGLEAEHNCGSGESAPTPLSSLLIP